MVRMMSTSSRSHPTGVRGLKYVRAGSGHGDDMSHPTGVRGLKYRTNIEADQGSMSHPTGVRGLKFIACNVLTVDEAGRTPLGCVD